MTPRVLIIAGSDSGGGAGVQADIKTVTMLGGHAMTAVTTLTAQNTLGVQGVLPVPPEFVVAQIDACLADLGADAIKIGMIGSPATVRAVADRLRELAVPIVVDPVMVATSGSVLADANTIAALGDLLELATVATPNLPELAALGGEARLLEQARAVLVKGGHAEGDVLTDRLLDQTGEVARWSGVRIATTSTHGTGCTLAAALALGLAEGRSLVDAIARARRFVRLALLAAPGLGHGHGPLGQQAVRLDLPAGATLNQFAVPLARERSAQIAFYRALGLRLIVDSAENGYARFEAAGGATLSLHGDSAAIYFECHDLTGAVAMLREGGYDIEEPGDQSWLWREAWTRDPGGQRVCLYQAGEARRYPPWRLP